ncbi:hypothetical protein DCE79_02695 [Lysinibacillus sp. 2017]|uniref:hypothetical protein n=1 Tax=unclassified Lysinibacillus TaxID=2636778 RepID=UPI000D525B83|nr:MULTISPECIES: hypothetical protein [unclassified Lysinibacillus]AWE06357.1 hypothetical protein DCE79_02695 [Lysinibacillus sp. 2017]TGN31165.1 hypothetical protein E4L99_16985 [Lysinibacillus sp. S2017]
MKKNIKVGLMAGLLITPAIVAQAGAVQAEEIIPGETDTGIGMVTEEQSKSPLQILEDLATPLLPVNKAKLTSEGIAAYKDDVTDAGNAIKVTSTSTLAKNNRLPISDAASKYIYDIIKEAETELNDLATLKSNIEKFKTDVANKKYTSATIYTKDAKNLGTAVEKLADYQKLFVDNYKDVENILSAEKVVTLIAGLDAKIAYNTAEYRTKVEDARKDFTALTQENQQPLVYNLTRLVAIEAIIKEVKELEGRVEDPTVTVNQIPTIVNDYNNSKSNYILTDVKAELDSWKSAVTTSATVEKQIQAISTEPFAKMGTSTPATKKTTVETFVKNVTNAHNEYNKIATPGEGKIDPKKLVQSSERIIALNKVAELAKNVVSFSTYSSSDSQAVENVETNLSTFDLGNEAYNVFTTVEKQDLQKLKDFLIEYLKERKSEQATIKEIDTLIVSLKTNVKIEDLATALELYNSLSKEAKPYVSEYTYLQNLDKEYKSALNVINSINNLKPEAKDFTSKTTSAKTAYDNLTSTLKSAVSNYTTLESLLPIANLMQDINKLKATSTTFRTEYEAASSTFKTLTTGVSAPAEGTTTDDKVLAAKQELLVTYGPKLDAFKLVLDTADTMIASITQLGTKKGQEFMDQLTALSAQYKALDSATKKNVTNAKTLTDLEKDYKSTLKVFNLIEQLPANKDKNFASKVVAAEKAYQNLTQKQKDDVYNYKKLQDVYKAADLIARIEKLKVGSKTFDADLSKLRSEYDALSADEKALVHNASKLTEAEDNRVLAEKVVALINEAVPNAEQYIAKLTAARAAYNALDATQKKLVTNIKDLTTHEKAVKPVLKLDDDILKLDPSNAKTFLSKFKSAEKAYDKLSITERGLLLNVEKFTGELRTIYKVADAINSVKASSKTFVADVKAARALYDDLSPEYKAQISNLSVLENHELNVLGGQKVDQLIQALGSTEPTQFITKVKEARVAFKALSSANKKAVTLEAELKAQEKYVKPVEKVITEIEGLTNPKNNLSKQFAKVNTSLQKLDDKQRSYITNIEKYSNLSNVTHVYDLIEKLKPNDRYYQGNLAAAKLSYDKLSQDEKLKVTNYYKLQEAQLNVDESQNIISIIATLSSKSSTYFVDIERALAAYKEIPSSLKKQVTNYDKLKQAEKDMKAVKKVITQIETIDPSAKTYASKAKSALKAYQKLTEEQKDLVSNYDRLQSAVNELNL